MKFIVVILKRVEIVEVHLIGYQDDYWNSLNDIKSDLITVYEIEFKSENVFAQFLHLTRCFLGAPIQWWQYLDCSLLKSQLVANVDLILEQDGLGLFFQTPNKVELPTHVPETYIIDVDL